MTLSISSIDRAPEAFCPLMKKVGVEFDLELVGGAVAHPFDAVEHLLIRQAGLEALLGEAGLLGDVEQRPERLFHRPLAAACSNSRSTIGKYLSLAAQRASMKAPAASGSSGNSRKMKRTLPVSMYFSFSFGKVSTVKCGAMRAGHRGVFDDRDRRVLRAHHLVAERAGLQQLRLRDGLREGGIDSGAADRAAASARVEIPRRN